MDAKAVLALLLCNVGMTAGLDINLGAARLGTVNPGESRHGTGTDRCFVLPCDIWGNYRPGQVIRPWASMS